MFVKIKLQITKLLENSNTSFSLERPLKVEKINLIQKSKSISNDTERCNILNGFSLILFPNLKSLRRIIVLDSDSILVSVSDSVMDSSSILSILTLLKIH